MAADKANTPRRRRSSRYRRLALKLLPGNASIVSTSGISLRDRTNRPKSPSSLSLAGPCSRYQKTYSRSGGSVGWFSTLRKSTLRLSNHRLSTTTFSRISLNTEPSLPTVVQLDTAGEFPTDAAGLQYDIPKHARRLFNSRPRVDLSTHFIPPSLENANKYRGGDISCIEE